MSAIRSAQVSLVEKTRTLTSGNSASSSLDSSFIRVGISETKGAGSGVCSVLLSSDAVPDPEGLGISSSLGVDRGGFLASSGGNSLSGLVPTEGHPVAIGGASEKKLMLNKPWNWPSRNAAGSIHSGLRVLNVLRMVEGLFTQVSFSVSPQVVCLDG